MARNNALIRAHQTRDLNQPDATMCKPQQCPICCGPMDHLAIAFPT